jgi:hypothetical protein
MTIPYIDMGEIQPVTSDCGQFQSKKNLSLKTL